MSINHHNLQLDRIEGIELLNDTNAEAVIGGNFQVISRNTGDIINRVDGSTLTKSIRRSTPLWRLQNTNPGRGTTAFFVQYFQPNGTVAATELTNAVERGGFVDLNRYDGNGTVDGRLVNRAEIFQVAGESDNGNKDILDELEETKKKIASGGTQVAGRDLINLFRS